LQYYFTNHPDNTPRMTLVRAIKARWVCEQGHQQMKDELGLDHYEGRSWLGLHHHALMTMMALAYLQHRRLNCSEQSGEKPAPTAPGLPPQPSLPAVRRAIIETLYLPICMRCPQCGAAVALHQRE
jgi:SRSO17 transposase